jgi:hypothetical protein
VEDEYEFEYEEDHEEDGDIEDMDVMPETSLWESGQKRVRFMPQVTQEHKSPASIIDVSVVEH